MAKEVRLPRFGMTMESAEVVRWLHAEGDYVTKGEALVELQNDKAVVPFESPESGYLRILATEGREYQVGCLLAVLLDAENETYIPADVTEGR
jgi:pyruvate/2-oxoglutarate dehydrogenase complex dihydrolipoamide acyltransferase (E2) component